MMMRYKWYGSCLLSLLGALSVGAAEIDVTKLKSFGTSGKREFILGGGKEAELFSYEGRGCLTHMWFGGDRICRFHFFKIDC